MNDRFYLNRFFKSLVFKNNGGHTVFFQKPVSVMTFFSKEPKGSDALYFSPYANRIIQKGWETWKKYQPLFDCSDFIFLEGKIQPTYFLVTPPQKLPELVEIYIINKRLLLETLIENEAVFKQMLGENFCPEKFMAAIEKKESLTALIGHHEGLLGILLGYGKQASLSFEDHLNEIQKVGFQKAGLDRITADKPAGCLIDPVVFVGDSESTEAKELIDHYSDELEKLHKIYRSGSFLKTTLAQLCKKS